MSEHPSESVIFEAAIAVSVGSCALFSILGIAVLLLRVKNDEDFEGECDEEYCGTLTCVLGTPFILLFASIIGASFGLVIGFIKTWNAIWTCLVVIGFILLGLIIPLCMMLFRCCRNSMDYDYF
jgi:formate-dependent nitrite reductase membrane component NrfD